MTSYLHLYHSKIFRLFLFVSIMVLTFSCKKNEYVGKDPYAGAKEPLQVKINTTLSRPSWGEPGSAVSITGKGFSNYLDSGMVVKFNGVAAEIEKASDSVLTVNVPEMASSGLITVTIAHQVFPGPYFQVIGPIAVDTLFHAVPGAKGTINCIEFIPGGKYLIGGSFTDYDNSGFKDGLHGLARVNQDGTVDRGFKIGKGVGGTVNSVAVQASGKYVIGGSFNNYDDRFGGGKISNLMRLNADGSVDSLIVMKETGEEETVSAFNAYFDGTVSKILQTPDEGKLIVLGGFNFFMKKDFTMSTLDGMRDSVIIDSIQMQGMAGLNEDGSFDTTFNYDPGTHRSYIGPNGEINDALMQSDGKIIIVGSFTKYRDKQAMRIARLNQDGSLDNTFNAGAGPDDRVYTVALMPGGKYVIGGQFNNVDGKENRKIAVLNADGSLDNGFNVGQGPNAGPDGIVLKVGVLKNNKIFASGFFDYFSGIKRDRTVILDADGSVSNKFNNLGAMVGFGVNDMVNVPNANASILVGAFSKYDLHTVSNILLLKY